MEDLRKLAQEKMKQEKRETDIKQIAQYLGNIDYYEDLIKKIENGETVDRNKY